MSRVVVGARTPTAVHDDEFTGRSPARPMLELWLTVAALVVTLIACAFFGADVVQQGWQALAARDWSGFALLLLFVGIVAFLIYGNLVYQCTRLGYVARWRRHRPPPLAHLVTSLQGTSAPAVAILVPSYKEELRTIRQTLLSAALQLYPNRRVVLLIDDPPEPTDPADRAHLAATRQLPAELTALLAAPAALVQQAIQAFATRSAGPAVDLTHEATRLLDTYAAVVDWFDARTLEHEREGADHTDRLFVELTFRRNAALYRERHHRLAQAWVAGTVSARQIEQEYNVLAGVFAVELTCFERKRYVNLAHEPNKAANLNSYLGLIGMTVQETTRDGSCFLDVRDLRGTGHVPPGARVIPDAVYVATLDADSLLSPDYLLRLVHLMEEPGNERLAVVQTPYSAIPGAPSTLERVAGATTDIQYIIHQGFTHAGATFWVGANALLRRAALDDIREAAVERGFSISRFIQDRTVIEDTESTVDLIARGWRLHNYPARLAYSATPPDFGALLIQRRRWANGGLLILPKLVRYALRPPFRWMKPAETLLRAHYLSSICGVNVGLLVLLLVPFGSAMDSVWLPLTAAPYFALYWRDLIQAGYRRGDILRVYALNLLLLPVNLGGVATSLQQGLTGAKIPFGRTPKVAGRTAAPAGYVLAEYLLFAYLLQAAAWDVATGRWAHALFALSNAFALGYAIVAFIGLRASRDDLLTRWTAPRIRHAATPATIPRPTGAPMGSPPLRRTIIMPRPRSVDSLRAAPLAVDERVPASTQRPLRRSA